MRSRARARRCAKFAISLPSVVGVAVRKILLQLPQCRRGARGKGLQLADGALARKRLQPLELDADTVSDEGLLAEIGPERIESLCVPAVERRQRGERRWHGLLLY